MHHVVYWSSITVCVIVFVVALRAVSLWMIPRETFTDLLMKEMDKFGYQAFDSEQWYLRGQKNGWIRILDLAIHQLGYEGDKDAKIAELILEREYAIAQLRIACRDFGDNHWSDHLHLADIIEKHLVRHIQTREICASRDPFQNEGVDSDE